MNSGISIVTWLHVVVRIYIRMYIPNPKRYMHIRTYVYVYVGACTAWYPDSQCNRQQALSLMYAVPSLQLHATICCLVNNKKGCLCPCTHTHTRVCRRARWAVYCYVQWCCNTYIVWSFEPSLDDGGMVLLNALQQLV